MTTVVHERRSFGKFANLDFLHGKTKKLSTFEKWGFGEERNGDFRDSKTRKPGVKFGCIYSISHYNEVQ